MPLLSFPVSPTNGQLYPATPLVGENQYEWVSAEQTWRLLGTATGVVAGCYGDSLNVGSFCVDATGRITSAVNTPITVTGGTVTDVTAGVGLLGGTITTSGTIDLDTAYTDGLYLGLAGGTMTGDITFSGTQTFPGTVVGSDFTAVGDLLVGTGASTYTALPVGADGNVLTANSLCAEGVEWIAGGGAPATPQAEGIVYALTEGGATFNTALGCDALNSAVSGAANVAVGASAGIALTSGSLNTLLGPGAGCAILDSTQNIAIGFQALGGLTTGTGSNIAIGSLSGVALTNENFNVVIGAHPGPTGLDCQIVLADGQGTLRAQINECGAISPDGATYGTCGQFLQSSGATSTWTWANGARVVPVPANSGVAGTLGEVAFGVGFFYFFDGVQWLRVAGNTF